MNFQAIHALVLRYMFLYTRSAVRFVELIFWPVMGLLVWGFLTLYLQRNTSGEFPQFITYLIGAVILWDVLFRAQQGVAISFLEDVWTRNLLNIFAAPIRATDHLAAMFAMGLFRIVVTVAALTILAAAFYAFNIFELRLALFPFFANLMVFGWSLGMISTALIMRWGLAAESLAWAVPFMIQPIAAVFYPVDVLPAWLQPVSLSLPCTHVFEGMREVLASGVLDWWKVARATGLNILYMAAAGAFFLHTLRIARRDGLLVKIATQ